MRGLTRLVLGLAACIGASENADANLCPPSPTTMTAARIASAGGPEKLRIETVDIPRIGDADVLVRVKYASINPVDWKLQQAGRLRFPATPGGDFSGEVVGVGAKVTGWQCGDLVAGIVDQVERAGSYAEFVSVPATEIVRKPESFTLQEASAYPTVAVAAWRFLLEGTGVHSGERVLVHGGAGGVGSMVVQMAKARGAYVIATASQKNHDYLRSIGADEVIDYRSTPFEQAVEDVDVVVDTVGGDTASRSLKVMRDGGRIAVVGGRVPPDLCSDARITCAKPGPWDVGRGLAAAGEFIASGKLKVNIDRVYPLSSAAEAQQHNKDGHTRGKVVIEVSQADTATRG